MISWPDRLSYIHSCYTPPSSSQPPFFPSYGISTNFRHHAVLFMVLAVVHASPSPWRSSQKTGRAKSFFFFQISHPMKARNSQRKLFLSKQNHAWSKNTSMHHERCKITIYEEVAAMQLQDEIRSLGSSTVQIGNWIKEADESWAPPPPAPPLLPGIQSQLSWRVGLWESASRLALDARGWLETSGLHFLTVCRDLPQWRSSVETRA
ncbi:hypothetical protein P175DRAFT_0264353 [Aspergillus ochraceoroseus IBT 24754]|uniref:Uncharacterized protein n=1 Tax=Aspergillus ochraceoroseus IBT 24754 TaxID=1392256 RepID=A0A2T5LUT3_9EURO|nr:uncharacterized protein P175DRAFT_0264353 [Aspergillus ochraceoroseus IBT 24754]PTU20048.1 hypothetical protein P175DRAFT_0264353 [Aspergillus ochraceoroseus IBT 24754]